jgi:hypothetical protein
MKQINISEKTYEFLKNLAREIKTQNNRATAFPYFYQIRIEEKIYGLDSDYTDNFIYLSKEDSEIWFETKEEVFYYLKEEYPDLPSGVDVEDFGFYRLGVRTVPKYENCFLTERAIRKHIKQNHYHYNNPTDYLSHAFRNPELEDLINAVFEIEELNKEDD